MGANILTERQRCERECSRTFHFKYGAALPGGPFDGTHGEAGDVRRCEHGRVWRFLRVERGGNWIDTWGSISRFWEPRDYRRALRALAVSDDVTATDGGA